MLAITVSIIICCPIAAFFSVYPARRTSVPVDDILPSEPTTTTTATATAIATARARATATTTNDVDDDQNGEDEKERLCRALRASRDSLRSI